MVNGPNGLSGLNVQLVVTAFKQEIEAVIIQNPSAMERLAQENVLRKNNATNSVEQQHSLQRHYYRQQHKSLVMKMNTCLQETNVN